MTRNLNRHLRRILAYSTRKSDAKIRGAICADDMSQLLILAAMRGNVALVIYAR